MPDLLPPVRTILDDVVHQFSEPLAFLRELVQNSIDAGTGEIEIQVTHNKKPSGPTAQISVRDWGEGMSREIIETKLVRLFRSGKDDDLTKIGRFGIGFVSVFAIEPDAVVVDTGRDGRYWRVLFDADRTYELYAVDEPIEGTEVRILKSMHENDFTDFENRAGKVLFEWCKHAEIPIFFNGDEVGSPFQIESSLTTRYDEEGTRVVMGCVSDSRGHAGYYNQGLTLKESERSPWPWVSFKIDSPYLEHTLTRDQLLEDQYLDKARRLLAELAEEKLPEKLMAALEDGAETGGSNYDRLCRYFAHYLRCHQPFHRRWRGRKIFRLGGGRRATYRQVRRAFRRERLHVVRSDGPEVKWFDDGLVLFGGPGLDEVLGALFGMAPTPLHEQYIFLERLRLEQRDVWKPLVKAVLDILRRSGFGMTEVIVVDIPAVLRGLSLSGDRALIVSDGEGPITEEDRQLPGGHRADQVFATNRVLLINGEDDQVERLRRLASVEPEWAALGLLEGLCQLDDTPLRVAVEAREERLREKKNGS